MHERKGRVRVIVISCALLSLFKRECYYHYSIVGTQRAEALDDISLAVAAACTRNDPKPHDMA